MALIHRAATEYATVLVLGDSGTKSYRGVDCGTNDNISRAAKRRSSLSRAFQDDDWQPSTPVTELNIRFYTCDWTAPYQCPGLGTGEPRPHRLRGSK